ncbi:uncharacterized protein RJT20DRAFT_57331 [Scheffersomyces xylosifermentans]|uniref:uncharacterized protein n=1 Tax=Scheffersomyces xylosifermentans TaxID=1304137 RepID=UPI00315C5B27
MNSSQEAPFSKDFGNENAPDNCVQCPLQPFHPVSLFKESFTEQTANINQLGVFNWGMFKGCYDTRRFRCYKEDCRNAFSEHVKCDYHNHLPYVSSPLKSHHFTMPKKISTGNRSKNPFPSPGSSVALSSASISPVSYSDHSQDYDIDTNVDLSMSDEDSNVRSPDLDFQLSTLICDLLDHIEQSGRKLKNRFHSGDRGDISGSNHRSSVLSRASRLRHKGNANKGNRGTETLPS